MEKEEGRREGGREKEGSRGREGVRGIFEACLEQWERRDRASLEGGDTSNSVRSPVCVSNFLSDVFHQHLLGKLLSYFKTEEEVPQVDTHWISESGVIDVFILLGPRPHDVFSPILHPHRVHTHPSCEWGVLVCVCACCVLHCTCIQCALVCMLAFVCVLACMRALMHACTVQLRSKVILLTSHTLVTCESHASECYSHASAWAITRKCSLQHTRVKS